MSTQGLDVSEFQGEIDWERVKNAGYRFAMLRAGYGSGTIDRRFRRNASECSRVGIPFGVYCRYGNDQPVIKRFLSLMSANQIIPLLVGLMGSFLGLFSMYFPPAAARLVLWGYFGAFLPFGMDWDKDTRILSFYRVPFPTTIFILFVVFGILLYLFCRAVFLKKEV